MAGEGGDRSGERAAADLWALRIQGPRTLAYWGCALLLLSLDTADGASLGAGLAVWSFVYPLLLVCLPSGAVLPVARLIRLEAGVHAASE